MERIPILRMGRLLLVTIQVDMHDRLAITLQDDLTERIVRTRGLSRGLWPVSLERGSHTRSKKNPGKRAHKGG